MDAEYSLRETRHLIRHLGNVVSKFNLEQVVELLITFTNHKKHNSFEFTDLLLLQRVIPMLKGNTVLFYSFVYTNSFRLCSGERAGYGRIISGLQCSVHATVTANRISHSHIDNAMYALATI